MVSFLYRIKQCVVFIGVLIILLNVGAATSARAVEPDERLADPVLEARARAISAELRCLVCQNQSIDDSSAPLARDLRLLVRERLVAGNSDADVTRFLVDRYGEFVLLRPRFSRIGRIGGHLLAVWLRFVVGVRNRERQIQEKWIRAVFAHPFQRFLHE